jgi:hypothetical protein
MFCHAPRLKAAAAAAAAVKLCITPNAAAVAQGSLQQLLLLPDTSDEQWQKHTFPSLVESLCLGLKQNCRHLCKLKKVMVSSTMKSRVALPPRSDAFKSRSVSTIAICAIWSIKECKKSFVQRCLTTSC